MWTDVISSSISNVGDPGADSGGKEKVETDGKKSTKKSKGEKFSSQFLFSFFFPARLGFFLVPTICPWVFEDVA